MLLQLEACGHQAVEPPGAAHHVEHRVTLHTLEVMVVRPVRGFKASRATRQINGHQVTAFQPFVQQAVDGGQTDAGVSKQRVDIRGRQRTRRGAERVMDGLAVAGVEESGVWEPRVAMDSGRAAAAATFGTRSNPELRKGGIGFTDADREDPDLTCHCTPA